MEQIVWQIIIGVLMAIIGLGVWRLQYVIVKNEKRRTEKEANRESLQLKIVRFGCANYLLSAATAIAIKNGKTNGEMEDALSCAKSVKDEVDSFLQEQGIKKVV